MRGMDRAREAATAKARDRRTTPAALVVGLVALAVSAVALANGSPLVAAIVGLAGVALVCTGLIQRSLSEGRRASS